MNLVDPGRNAAVGPNETSGQPSRADHFEPRLIWPSRGETRVHKLPTEPLKRGGQVSCPGVMVVTFPSSSKRPMLSGVGECQCHVHGLPGLQKMYYNKGARFSSSGYVEFTTKYTNPHQISLLLRHVIVSTRISEPRPTRQDIFRAPQTEPQPPPTSSNSPELS